MTAVARIVHGRSGRPGRRLGVAHAPYGFAQVEDHHAVHLVDAAFAEADPQHKRASVAGETDDVARVRFFAGVEEFVAEHAPGFAERFDPYPAAGDRAA